MPPPSSADDSGKHRSYWVAINCPNAGLPTPVGVSTNKSSFKTSSFQNNTFSCDVCGRMHTWNGTQAFLVVPRGEYVGQPFDDDVIVLDGSSFDQCKINRCKIHLSRGNFRLTNSSITNSQFFFAGEAQAVKNIVDSLKG